MAYLALGLMVHLWLQTLQDPTERVRIASCSAQGSFSTATRRHKDELVEGTYLDYWEGHIIYWSQKDVHHVCQQAVDEEVTSRSPTVEQTYSDLSLAGVPR